VQVNIKNLIDDVQCYHVVVKYVGDTFLNLSYEKQSAHPDKKGSPVPPE
jgi:hypothetical protein